jgi:hypothetical protein
MRFAFIASLGLTLVISTAATGAAPQSGQQTPPPAPAAAKPADAKTADAKTTASVAGKWDMSAETPQGTTPVTLVIKLDGKKVTGTMAGPQGEIPMEGEFADGKLTWSISFQGNGGSMNITFNGTLKDDGTLAGTFDFGQGEMKWSATRAKN